ncbi:MULTISPECIES: glycosyltransferase family 4 protein [Clostridia]|uniref:glycosyltransferase family 4 protein n=1 Tax=Clostridia TaxID=186801 RepID=UPI000EA07109|nr:MULTISPECIES: glycosyltransferase family 4 protein [Clostridia]NBJ68804.1 glycosyltransferase WbuB [Roseburia sp. 1XD42-34]RKI80183.1 glycosyltransferase WbuB [Clostridium sp. 1xD42-85]
MTRKVLVITQNFYPVIGSAGNRMKNIFQLLNDKGIETHVLTTEPAYPNKNLYKDKQFWDDKNIIEDEKKIVRVPIKNNHFSNHILNRLFFYIEIMWRFLLKLWKLRKEKYDYIYVSTPPIFIVFAAFVGAFFMKARVVLEVRDLWPDSLIGVKTFDHPLVIECFRFLEKSMYKKADTIIINSLGFEQHIKSKLKDKSKQIIYLPNGPRKYEIVSEKEQQHEFRVVYTGNLGLAQDVGHLKKLASLFQKHNIRFDVLGYGIKTKGFKEHIEKNGLSNVYMHHPTTRKKSLELIKQSNLSIAFLNDNQVFETVLPGKVIDYMTCQTPVIAGVKGTAAKIIETNKTGFVFDQNNISGMINKILELKEKPEELRHLGENCTHTVMKNFLWEDNIEKLMDIFDR